MILCFLLRRVRRNYFSNLFLMAVKQKKQENGSGQQVKKKGFKKVKSFKKIPDDLKSIKVEGITYRLSPLKTLPWGCGMTVSKVVLK